MFLVLRRLFPYLFVVFSLSLVYLKKNEQQVLSLYIQGELPYGYDVDLFEKYINHHGHELTNAQERLYQLLDQTGQYKSIFLKKIQPDVYFILLNRKKAIATCDKQEMLMDDGSIVFSNQPLELNYHMTLKSRKPEKINEIINMLSLLEQYGYLTAKLNIGVLGDITIEFSKNITIKLPAHQSLSRCRTIFDYYQANIPANYEIDGRYESGFIFNKKQSARI